MLNATFHFFKNLPFGKELNGNRTHVLGVKARTTSTRWPSGITAHGCVCNVS